MPHRTSIDFLASSSDRRLDYFLDKWEVTMDVIDIESFADEDELFAHHTESMGSIELYVLRKGGKGAPAIGY
jgi:hypothetical protein